MRLLIGSMLLVAAAFAQTDANTITITASRNVTVTPDQVRFFVTVTTPLGTALTDVVASLAGTQITAADLTDFSADGVRGTVDWSFQWTVPISKMKDATATLTALQQKTIAFNYSVTGVQVSTAAMEKSCDYTALVNDARTAAERIASAAGVRVGGVARLSDFPGETTVVAQFRSGVFATLSRAVVSNPFAPVPSNSLIGFLGSTFSVPPTPACQIQVTFRIL